MLQSSSDASPDEPEINISPDVSSLAETVELARTGDARAFTILFQTYNNLICLYLARLVGNDEVGRDLAQETFLRAWKSLPTISGELHFKPWLYRIATNLANSHLRHERLIHWLPWKEQEYSLERLSIVGPEALSSAETAYVKLALAHLSPQYRTCLLLQLVGGFSQREIAEMLHISEKSVSANVSRGREQFRRACRTMKGESAHGTPIDPQGQYIYALHVTNGSLIGKYKIGLMDSLLAVHNGLMYVQNGYALYVLQPSSGRVLWQFRANDLNHSPDITIADERVYVSAENNSIYILQASNGHLIHKITQRLSSSFGPLDAPLVADGIIYTKAIGGISMLYKPLMALLSGALKSRKAMSL